jgi:hypothetical protein
VNCGRDYGLYRLNMRLGFEGGWTE